MNTSVFVERLRIYAHHGVLEQERKIGNLFEVSVKVTYDFKSTLHHDEIDRVINYVEVVDIVKEVMAEPANLIETVAMRITDAIRARWVEAECGGRVVVTKVHPPFATPCAGASAIVEW